MNLSATLVGQSITLHLILMVGITWWHSSRSTDTSFAKVLLLLVCWILPIIGPIILASYTLGMPGRKRA